MLLLGDPVAHSMAAALHNAGFKAAGLPVRYVPQRVTPEALAGAITGMRQDPDVLGATVAMPHKLSVVSLLDGLGPEAQALQAVNTISRRAGVLIGWNTDRAGFAFALEDAAYQVKGRSALILGAGGSARAAADVLRGTARRVMVADEDPEQARRLCQHFELPAGGPVPLASLKAAVGRADLIVNATPVGLDGKSLPFPAAWLKPTHFVFDLLYTPPLTPLVRAARARGARAINGLTMLLQQGISAFQIWTGAPAPEAAMRAALERAVLERLSR